MSALTDGNGAYVITESGHVYTLAERLPQLGVRQVLFGR